ncbi:hypothetical protein Hypma_003073 [Hypsizygus marmoreus]|uniref:F-box domain-containing protein n=1 Tax=Hypsizygus marmoreus TaxID=39966 RepID=A0A369JA51_HYPMA|nr:hypothetical protein Hypma_003073 [Hypsizygus marmoreus]
MTSHTRLPNDMIWAIIEELNDDTHILATCASVCRSWYNFSQPRRFRHIKLAPHDRFNRFHHIIADSPHVASFVESLELSVSIFMPEYEMNDMGASAIQLPSKDITMLSDILSCLTKVQRFVLRGSSVTWDHLPQFVRSAILTFLRLNSPSFLELSHWMFLPGRSELRNLIRQPLALAELALFALDVAESDVPIPTSPEARDSEVGAVNLNRISPPSMSVYSCNRVRDWLLQEDCIIDISSVRHLKLLCDHPLASDILKLAGSTLETLRCYCFSVPETIDLSHNPHIKDLTLVSWMAFVDCKLSVPTALIPSLETISPSNDIRILRLMFNTTTYPHTAFGGSWAQLVATLASATFRSLRRLEMLLCSYEPEYRLHEAMVKASLGKLGIELVVMFANNSKGRPDEWD